MNVDHFDGRRNEHRELSEDEVRELFDRYMRDQTVSRIEVIPDGPNRAERRKERHDAKVAARYRRRL